MSKGWKIALMIGLFQAGGIFYMNLGSLIEANFQPEVWRVAMSVCLAIGFMVMLHNEVDL